MENELYHVSKNPYEKWEDFISRETDRTAVVTIDTFSYFLKDSFGEYSNHPPWKITGSNVGEDLNKPSRVYYPIKDSYMDRVVEYIVQDIDGKSLYTACLSETVPLCEEVVNYVLLAINNVFGENFIYRGRPYKYRIKTNEEVTLISSEERDLNSDLFSEDYEPDDYTKDTFFLMEYTEEDDKIRFNYCGNEKEVEKDKIEEIKEL